LLISAVSITAFAEDASKIIVVEGKENVLNGTFDVGDPRKPNNDPTTLSYIP